MMEFSLVKEIISCLPEERTFFYYFNDRYAVYLLQRALTSGPQSVNELKQSRFGKLLKKEVISQLLANKGDGVLEASDLQSLWPHRPHVFTLTLDEWGGKYRTSSDQMTGMGANLVLQLNFNNELTMEFERFMPGQSNYLNFYFHPTHRDRTTLAWARMDIDFDTNEVLIEEIQSDWIREMKWIYQYAKKIKKSEFTLWCETYITKSVISFYEQVAKPLTDQWSEAMLTATAWFVWEELGIEHLYMHTQETGCALKQMKDKGYRQPRSLYSDLPRKFCFEKTQKGPEMIVTDRKLRKKLNRINNPQWHYLAA